MYKLPISLNMLLHPFLGTLGSGLCGAEGYRVSVRELDARCACSDKHFVEAFVGWNLIPVFLLVMHENALHLLLLCQRNKIVYQELLQIKLLVTLFQLSCLIVFELFLPLLGLINVLLYLLYLLV